MKRFQVHHIANVSLADVAIDQAKQAQFITFLSQMSAQGWTCDHIFEINSGLLFVLSK